LGAHAVVGEDFLGGLEELGAPEDRALDAAAVEGDLDELVAAVAQDLDEVGEVLDGDAVDGFHDVGDGVVVALGELVREEGRADDDELLAGEGGLVADAQQQRVGGVAEGEADMDPVADDAADERLGRAGEDDGAEDEIGRVSRRTARG
jgi:hypothetical protein